MNTEKTYKTDDGTLIHALRILARDIKSPDNIANLAIFEAADRIESLAKIALENEKKANDAGVKLAKAVNALRPFAEFVNDFSDEMNNRGLRVTMVGVLHHDFTVGDLRRAAAVVAEIGGCA